MAEQRRQTVEAITGSSFGQRRPPLTHILKSILERYPDGGQILKEIIQNADDADATKVSFLLDSRQGFYGKNSLVEPTLAQFQGPALYAQNNALFQESDWENLQRLMHSSKRDDPLKVGRFGIGFNSVYHITDLPSIVSGDSIVFLDPHETHFGRGETGRQYSLKKELLQIHEDQFKPYENVLGCKISTQFYSGTLFRFPLRSASSDLSKKVYSKEKVGKLFQALKREAPVILLFLKNIEEIALFETDEKGFQKHLFTVRLSDSCRQEVREKKRKFLSDLIRLSNGQAENVNLSLDLHVVEVTEGERVVENRWLVYHQVDVRNPTLKQLSLELGLLPWVGCATLVKAKLQALLSNTGRIFCFLPLPPDADSKTGLPVHVHGYFGLTDNRRGLKWPGPDCQDDPTAEWNVLLVEHVASKAYANVLLFLRESCDSSDGADLVYKSWPNIHEVENHWQCMLKPMFSILLNENVFWTPASHDHWKNLSDAHLDRIESQFQNVTNETRDVVLETLTQANEAVVIVPSHVMIAIDKYTPVPTKSITPAFLRDLLKKKNKGVWNITNVPKNKKLSLLEFALEDKNLDGMHGVPLLPLADGSFADFRPLQYNREPTAAVYVSSASNPRSIFHNMDHKFLDDNVQTPAVTYLSKIALDASSPHTIQPVQLVKLNQTIAVRVLREMLPSEWSGGNHLAPWYPGRNGHPPEQWLQSVWMWIQRMFPTDISMLENLPLIPHTCAGNRSIVKLNASSVVIRRHHHHNISLPPLIVSLLGKIGCVVLENLPVYIYHNTLHRYVATPDPHGVLKIFCTLGQSRCTSTISLCSSDEKRALRSFLSSAYFNDDERNLLCHLPIFDAADRNAFIAVRNEFQVHEVSPYGFELPQSLPIPRASSVIALRDNDSHTLIQRLRISPVTKTTFLKNIVFSGIQSNFYSHQQISTLMSWVLSQYSVFCREDSSFQLSLQQLPFVITRTNKLVTPCCVLDPQQPILEQLFENENDKFPNAEFVKDEILLRLRQLGMRSIPNKEDILHVAKTIECVHSDVGSRKALALLEFLDKNPPDRSLGQALMNERWVTRKQSRPSSYPSVMPWFSGTKHFYKPSETFSQSKATLVGVSAPLVSKLCSKALEAVFGWNKSPPVHHLLDQLRSACSVLWNDINGSALYHFQAMVKQIYKEAATNTSFIHAVTQDKSFPEWIWHGNGFSSPAKIALKSCCRIDLRPYLYIVPQEFRHLSRFFQQCGVRDTFQDSDLLHVLTMIKDKHDTSSEYPKDVEDDRKLALEILQWIIRDGKQLDPELRETLLVPIQTWDNTLELVPCSECTFCDADWLRMGGSELLITSEFPMIHEALPSKTAALLGVPPISTRVTCAEALGIEQTGPYEPITTRLKNILNEYKEGVGVFKELVQNADDAGATEVQFVLDWRSHPNEKLLSPEMVVCQGPALLAYNNATFTDDDLKNISRLAGATKKEDLEKIGRFGLGFSSVYHFTDVPGFITRSYAVFFDPETTHLGPHLKDTSKPGIKIDLAINRKSLTCFPDQFAPYNGLFGCETASPSDHDRFYFQGTFFRFPFRTKRGEISDKIYTKQEIRSLMFSFRESSPTLLLFSQNVKKVSFLEVDENATDSKHSRLLFEVSRKAYIECTPVDNSISESTFLKSCAAWTRQSTCQSNHVDRGPSPKLTELISVCSTICRINGQSQQTQSWLVTSYLGTENSFQLATSAEGKNQGLLSASGVAAKISADGDGLGKVEKVLGEVFCFLPLSIPTGLPVHANGYFSVTSNRRGIWESTTTDACHEPLEVRWNQSLMEDALTRAYVQLLNDMIVMKTQGKISSYDVFSLWPNPDNLQSSAWEPLIKSFYQRIVTYNLPFVCTGGKWLPVTQCIYQDLKLRELPNSEMVLEKFDYKIVQLPDFAKKGFQQAGCMDVIVKRTMTQEKFLQEVFFPNITRIPKELRDPIVCHLIDECLRGHASHRCNQFLNLYKSLLSNNRCIPYGPDAGNLTFPRELISPKGAAATLFSAEDRRFPVGSCYQTSERLFMLQNLGMLSDTLDWETLIERANSVSILCRRAEEDAKERSALLIKYINDHFEKMDHPSEVHKEELVAIAIFPTLAKPAGYVLPWRGSGDCNSVMLPAKEMYDEKYKYVAGSSRPILDESESCGCNKLREKTRDLFGFSSRKPSAQEALNQLEYTVQATIRSPRAIKSLEKAFHSLYTYLQELILEPDGKRILQTLQKKEWILVNGKCLSACRLAFTWRRFGEPYLNEVPQSLSSKYRSLFQASGVKTNFSSKDVISALYKLNEDKQGEPLSSNEFRVSKSLIEELSEALESTLEKERGKIPLPDENLFLQPAEKLAINDAPWVVKGRGIDYVHKDLSIDLAHRLGAIDIRTKKLARISRPMGRKFGQREELTDRLKGILKAYPCDVGVLKELLQNADDAGATEVHFIVDPRYHNTDQLLSDNWRELQGPALCVYNNRPFSEKDLEGIQRLGIGSKADDPTKIGQYGIGFNAVYHLTDCPSFISNGDTLCILDPHYRYAPGADKENPGCIIGPIGEEERSDFRDIFPCYLEDMFDLKSSTMFRFPLRRQNAYTESLISETRVSSTQIKNFMNHLATEVREIILFLNHVKKISLSEIKEEQLKEIHSVSVHLTDDDDAERLKLANHIKSCKVLNTNEIQWFGVTYPLVVQEGKVRQEKWLIHQCIGIQRHDGNQVPNGQDYGLLPRGGIAAKVSEKSKFPSYERHRPIHKAFCFLPLPVCTGLPVHVNGHFFLDSARRNLWIDEEGKGFGSHWNHFMKSKVLAQAYVSLMLVARGHLPGSKNGDITSFSKEFKVHDGMDWYHNLFPQIESVKNQWRDLAKAVFQKICDEDVKLLPLIKRPFGKHSLSSQRAGAVRSIQPPHDGKSAKCDFIECEEAIRCFWLSPSQGFFDTLSCSDESARHLPRVILNIGFQLVYSSHKLFKEFKTAGTNVREVTPDGVIEFLKGNPNSVGLIPCPVGETTLGSVPNVLLLLKYCMDAPNFLEKIFGIPLLLTEDDFLRRFQKDNHVFLSLFADLIPNQRSRFIHHTFATPLLRFEKEIFEADQGVLKKFDIRALASLLPSIVKGRWCKTNSIIPWDLTNGPSERWLKLLWKFLFKGHEKEPDTFSLAPLLKWPILPTKSKKLAPLLKGKVILDLTPSESWSCGQKTVVALLRKLGCPEVDVELISSDRRRDLSPILKQHLSYPNSLEDILKVLNYVMREVDISGYLSDDEMLSLLQFFQDGAISLKRDRLSTSILKRLPFFKTFDGTFVSLENAGTVYVIPKGLPTDERDVWMRGNNCLFLAPEPKLNDLYGEVLDIDTRTHTDCYINFIFPKFPSLTMQTRMRHLSYVKRILLAPYSDTDQLSGLLQSLRTLKFIPDIHGSLRTPSYFFDPRVKVFEVMLPREEMPPLLFSKESDWLDLLCKVGLRQQVGRDEFLEFSKEVAKQAENMTKKTRIALEKKSQTLVTHLLNEKSFHEAEYLQKLSMIKFVASAKASDKLLALHMQYPCFEDVQDGPLPFIHFHGSISNMKERLAWTTAPLLPDWAVPDAEDAKLKTLGVLSFPSLDQVINHVTILSQSVLKDIEREIPQPKRRLLGDIMTEVYTFLQRVSGCQKSNSLNSCTYKCYEIGRRLYNNACVLVEDGRVYVRGDQLAFHLDEQLAPYLYKVPREYGSFQHLLLRLGAVEKATPEQFAKLLNKLKASCPDKKINLNEDKIVKHAVHGLFTTLKTLQDHKKDEPANNALSKIERLYLPSSRQKLERSVDLVLFDLPWYMNRLPTAMYEPLDLLRKYNLTFATPQQIVDLLPAHLKIPSVTALVREELHSECRDKKCRADVEKKCQETNRLRHLLFSPKLVDGIIRILKYQYLKAKLNEEVRGNVSSFQNELQISCMEILSTELVENRSNTSIPGSQRSKNIDCFVEREESGKKHIFIKHGVGPTNIRRVLCKEINQLTGCYVDKDSWLYLVDMLECESPEDISFALDKAGVSEDVENNDTPKLEPDLGTELPEELHYLLEQYGDFYFLKGEVVAYEKDDSAEEQLNYISAKIVYKLTTKTKTKKDRTKRRQKGESKLLERYLIDTSRGKKEVDVLDLYRIGRPQTVQNKDDKAEEECFSKIVELLPDEGTDRQSAEPEGAESSATFQSKDELPKPRALDVTTKEVRRKLAEIWKLPEDKRKKAVMRLYLQWHPDKNIDIEDIANEVIKFIQNEVERLSKRKSTSNGEGFAGPPPQDFSDFFTRWNERARRQRSSYENFLRHNPGFTGILSQPRRTYTAPNLRVAKMWMRQGKEDLRSVKLLLTARDPLYYLVCFQCHQIAEKSLKAALYALSGVADRQLNSHDLVLLAHNLSLLPEAPDVTPQVARLSDYYGGTRYPDKHVPHKVPADVFQDSQQAQEAFRLATEVIERLEQLVGE